MLPSLPFYDPKRQADGVVRAYLYQFLETAIAWLELGPSESLLVEVAEDYDIQSTDGQTTLTQVTHSSTSQRLTLNSAKSRDALTNFWEASRNGDDPSIQMVLHTNMTAGHEAIAVFPDNQTGIDYWAKVKSGADSAPLQKALITILKSGPLLDWLKTMPSHEEVASKLYNRITWRVAQSSGPERKALLSALLISRLSALGLPTSLATNATNAVIYRVLETASNPEVDARRLSAKGLNSFLNEIVRPEQPGHEKEWGLASWTSPVDSLPLPRICAPRDQLAAKFAAELMKSSALWLHGASGAGKSTLAQQTSAKLPGIWLIIDFRNQDEVTEVLGRLERAYTDVTITEGSVGVILDDVQPDLISRNAKQFSIFLNWMRLKKRHLIVTSAQAPSPALAAQVRLDQSSIVQSPYLERADVQDMANKANAPDDMIEAWSLFIHTASALGHPQLVAAKISSLEHRSWPTSSLTEDLIGNASDAVELTRREARQRLLREATEDGRKLLKRLACIFLRFDRSMAITAASVDPAIPDPSASLDFLIGPWIERAPGSGTFYRLSPLLTGLNEDLNLTLKKKIQAGVVINTVQKGPIPFEALDVIVWNAIFGEQGWFFVKFFEKILTLNEGQNEAFASKLSTIVYLSTDHPILPNDLGASMIIRLIQLDVAALNRDDRLFQSIAKAALHEAGLNKTFEVQKAMRVMTLSKILFAQGGRLEWTNRLAWLEEYDLLLKSDLYLTELTGSPAVVDIFNEFGPEADIAGFFLLIGLNAIQSPEELHSLFTALDSLSIESRNRWLKQFRVISKGYDLHVQSSWVNAWSAGNLNAEVAILEYQKMEELAIKWNENPLAHQCIIAQAVLWDEYVKDRVTALKVVNEALGKYPDNFALLRQKAKVLGHDGDYKGAQKILQEIKPQLADGSSIEQLYALKEEAVASSRLGDFQLGRTLFLHAANTVEKTTEVTNNLQCHKIALKAEAALCAWRMHDAPTALREFAAIIVETSEINPKENDIALMLHVNMRWLVGWFDLTTQIPFGAPPPILVSGAMSALDQEVVEEHRKHRGPFDDVKLLLLISLLRMGIADPGLGINWTKTTPGFHLFLVGAEFDLAVESGKSNIIASAILNLGAGFGLVANRSNNEHVELPIKNGGGIKLVDLEIQPIRVVIEQSVSVTAFKMRHKVENISEFVLDLLRALEEKLDAEVIFFSELRAAVMGNQTTNLSSNAARLISSLLKKSNTVPHPNEVMQYHLDLIGCVASSGASTRTVHEALSAISADWTYVVEHQRFLFKQPALFAPQLKSKIKKIKDHEPGALTELLMLAAQALNIEVHQGWEEIITRVGGTSTAT